MFFQTKRHRKPVDILKSFISARGSKVPALKASEAKELKKVFTLLASAYRAKQPTGTKSLGLTPLATDQAHMYTMTTALIGSALMTKFNKVDLTRRLTALGNILTRPVSQADPRIRKALKRYVELSSDRTTDAPRREERQQLFEELVSAL